ncbi:hypothetical protein LFL97_37535 (plasmid) [Burkholderia sp. JSH-S8]|nr:hypothetical protein LFL97_37535 [Burkholderia sp. JSH-S8]
MTDTYKAKEYYRQAQRFVYPLYKRDGRDGFIFSSTATFLTHKDRFFCIFASHALADNENSIDNIGFLTTSFEFLPLSESCSHYKIYRDSDVVICISNRPFDGRNHFELIPKASTTEFKTDAFGWIGFPQKKALQTIHKSKATPEALSEHLSLMSDGRYKWSNAKFLIIGAMIESKSENLITGRFENQNVNYEYDGFKQHGYSPRGMSGGALFHGPKKLHSEPRNLRDLFLFAGIGLEYNDTLIKGIPRELVTSLVEATFNSEATQLGDAR